MRRRRNIKGKSMQMANARASGMKFKSSGAKGREMLDESEINRRAKPKIFA